MNDAYAPNKREVKRMTDNEKAAYLRGRRDKACEVIQDIYCNHGGNSHPVYDFFQDSEIGYEEIVGWKLEAKRFCEQKVIEKYATLDFFSNALYSNLGTSFRFQIIHA